MDERKLIYADDAIRWVKIECNPYGKPTLDFESGKKVIEYLERLPSAQPEQLSEIQDILEYLDTVLRPIISPDHWNVYSELHDMISMLPSAQSEITDKQAIEHLQSTGWMQNHDKQMYEMGLKEQLADDSGGYDSLIPSAQPEQIARDIATIIENEKDMRVILKNAEHTETHSCDCERTATHGWIPVTERLPDVRQWVLCQCRANIMDVLRLTDDGGWYRKSNEIYMSGFVLAWMPLPEPYKEGQDDT